MAKGSLLRALLSGAYSLAWTAATPFLRRHKRLREGFMWRLVPEDWSGPVTRTGSGDTEKTVHAEADIWLQAASGGEAYLVWELLSRIAAQREQAGTPEPLRVLATTWTRQGLEVLQGMAIRLKEAHPWLTVRATFFPLQAAAVAGLTMGPEYYEWLKELYTKKRDFFCGGLTDIGFSHTVPQGSYFVLIDISDFLALPQFKGWSDLQFCEWMITNYKVAAVPGSSFFREPVNHLIRMHFACGEETLAEALRRMRKMREETGIC